MQGKPKINWKIQTHSSVISDDIEHWRANNMTLHVFYIRDRNCLNDYIKEECFVGDYIHLFNNHGIYFLMDKHNPEKPIYVGQTTEQDTRVGIKRIKDHLTDEYKDDWKSAIFFTCEKTDVLNNRKGFTNDELNYLERYFYFKIKESKNCKLLNKKTPSRGVIEPSSLDSAIDAIEQLMQNKKFDYDLETPLEDNKTYLERLWAEINEAKEELNLRKENLDERENKLAHREAELVKHKKSPSEKAREYSDLQIKAFSAKNRLIRDRVVYLGTNKKDEVPTSLEVAKPMVDMLGISELDINEATEGKGKLYVDIYCKSGIFLACIMDKYMELADKMRLSRDAKRKMLDNLIEHQLLGICDHQYLGLLSNYYIIECIEKHIYKLYNGRPTVINMNTTLPNIVVAQNYRNTIKNKDKNERVKLVKGLVNKAINGDEGETNQVKIDVVIGNPPYNNDLYLDFVQLGHDLAEQCTVMITPAKWQAKGGQKNEDFRKNVVPNMREIVMYKDSTDVFNIEEWGGVSYFLIDKDIHPDKIVTNICNKNKALASGAEIHSEDKLLLMPNKVKSIIDKCSTGKRLGDTTGFSRFTFTSEQERGHELVEGEINIPIVQGTKYTGGYILKEELKTTDNLDKYKVITSCMWGNGNAIFDKSNKVIGVTNMSIVKPNEVPKGSFIILKYFDTEEESKSFISYMYCKLNAFLIYNGLVGATLNKEFWRFVPDPVNFDHIFTDAELYSKYNLNQEEIDIIESVIKERK